MLSSYADGRTRLAWPSQATLAHELGWITRSTGQPDRWRVSHALMTLIEADLVREAGRHRQGERAWTNRYLVAPFPAEDAGERYASSKGSTSEDAYENASRMRTNPVEDATPTYAQTDPKNRPTRTEASSREVNEDQEPELRPDPVSYERFNHPKQRRSA